MLRLGIIGHGFVGNAIDQAFTKDVQKYIVDPKYAGVKSEHNRYYLTEIDDLIGYEPDVVFIAVPTPMDMATGDVDTTILDRVIHDLANNDSGVAPSFVTVIKSTVTPQHLDRYFEQLGKLVYNPEFLTEKNAVWDFQHPPVHIIGTMDADAASIVISAYNEHSTCKPAPVRIVDHKTASLVKYTINSFLATKVAFFNQVHELFTKVISSDHDAWEAFRGVVALDTRIGLSHTQVPGPDGKFGFGGTCFPKDTNGLVNYGYENGVELTVLDSAIVYNDELRPEYAVEADDVEEMSKKLVPFLSKIFAEVKQAEEKPVPNWLIKEKA